MQQLIKKIETTLRDKVNPGFVGEDTGQINNTETLPALSCILIDIPSVTFENTTGLVQQGKATVTIRLIESSTSSTGWETVRKINTALHGQKLFSEQFGYLTRTDVKRTVRLDNLIEYVLSYSLQFTDTTSQPVYELKHAPKPHIEVN